MENGPVSGRIAETLCLTTYTRIK